MNYPKNLDKKSYLLSITCKRLQIIFLFDSEFSDPKIDSMATCLYERNWRRSDYSRTMRRKIICSKVKKILNRSITFAEEVLLQQVATLMIEVDRQERSYDSSKAMLDKSYLSNINRLDTLFMKLGLIKKAKKAKQADNQEFDFSKVLSDDS